MSELFDKEVNAQKESFKKSSGIHASSHKLTKKCAMKVKQRKMMLCKMLLTEGSTLWGEYEKQAKTIWTNFGSTILDTIKVPFV